MGLFYSFLLKRCLCRHTVIGIINTSNQQLGRSKMTTQNTLPAGVQQFPILSIAVSGEKFSRIKSEFDHFPCDYSKDELILDAGAFGDDDNEELLVEILGEEVAKVCCGHHCLFYVS